MHVLKVIWEGWKVFARKFGDFQARILLAIFYFVFLGPFAVALQWRSDPLTMKVGAPLGWQPKGSQQGTQLEGARRQF